MRYLVTIILAVLLLTSTASGKPSRATCPEVSDFECLVDNSLRLYSEDFAQWWEIYHLAAAKAKKCMEVGRFLRLWLGNTDGEMAQSLSSDTTEILVTNANCFFEALFTLPEKERADIVDRYCPIQAPGPILSALREATANPRFEPSAQKLIDRVENKECI